MNTISLLPFLHTVTRTRAHDRRTLVLFPVGHETLQTNFEAQRFSYSLRRWYSFSRNTAARTVNWHSPPFSVKLMNEWNYIFSPPHAFMACTGTPLLFTPSNIIPSHFNLILVLPTTPVSVSSTYVFCV
jgi:hypothetical protein